MKFKLFYKILGKSYSKKSFNSNSNRSVLYYVGSLGMIMTGLTYAGVPLYRKFCQTTGIGGNSDFAKVANIELVKNMVPVRDRELTVQFQSSRYSTMSWDFHPVQDEIKLVPGETALAFYRARNPTNKPVVGIATYNIIPVEAGKYFHKIQCFCFEEQRLNPGEEVDMPVFFFIDPEYDNDPKLHYADKVVLVYTFFEAKEGLKLPLPGFLSND